jgi:hypothetical protein
MYNPDKWTILKITSDKDIYKILAGWSGGYLDSDRWRLSSGLEKIEDEGDYYLMHNYSGSIYKCHKKAEGFTGLSSYQFERIKRRVDEAGYSLEVVTPEQYKQRG